jgi:hypothetical protein
MCLVETSNWQSNRARLTGMSSGGSWTCNRHGSGGCWGMFLRLPAVLPTAVPCVVLPLQLGQVPACPPVCATAPWQDPHSSLLPGRTPSARVPAHGAHVHCSLAAPVGALPAPPAAHSSPSSRAPQARSRSAPGGAATAPLSPRMRLCPCIRGLGGLERGLQRGRGARWRRLHRSPASEHCWRYARPCRERAAHSLSVPVAHAS